MASAREAWWLTMPIDGIKRLTLRANLHKYLFVESLIGGQNVDGTALEGSKECSAHLINTGTLCALVCANKKYYL